jgi:hypothetical protein
MRKGVEKGFATLLAPPFLKVEKGGKGLKNNLQYKI